MAEETATSTRQSLYDEYATPDTPLTHRLLLLIVIVFLFEIVGVLIFSLSTIRVFATGIFQIWPWVAWPLSPLLHKGMNHIVFNFLLLLLVGVPVEQHWDDTQYAVFLLVVGYVTVLCGAGIMAVFSDQQLAYYGVSGIVYALAGFALTHMLTTHNQRSSAERVAMAIGAAALLHVMFDVLTGPHFTATWFNGGHVSGYLIGVVTGLTRICQCDS